jgi:O-acetyl-ADP-ribose deacetylase (regulator of RNase III)
MGQLHYTTGDIFQSDAQVLVNPVNCRGVMGAGLALAFKQRYPEMFAAYVQECKSGQLRIGRPMLYRANRHWILNFPTKDHWRDPAKLEYIMQGLHFLVEHYRQMGIESIAFPKLGAGLGKLPWNEVGPLMAKYLSQLECKVVIYIEEGDTAYLYVQGNE